jgi:hypothetical protein
LWRVFDAGGSKANTEHQAVKASASEVLHLYSLLRHWVETRVPNGDPRIALHVDSFLAVCKATDVILLAKRRSVPLAEAGIRLRAALQEFMKRHIVAYGIAHIRPKHHWAFDVADQMEKDAFLFDAFVIERLHLRVRCIADNVKDLHTFERSVLSGVVNDQCRRGKDHLCGGGLLGRTAPFPNLPDALVSDKVELGGLRIAVGDVVFRGEELGVVVACGAEEAELFVVVDPWHRIYALSAHSSAWALRSDVREVWGFAEIAECGAWQRKATGEIIAIRL